MKSKVLKRIIAVACAVTMITSGMPSSVGAVEWVTDEVVTKNNDVKKLDEDKQKVNELNACTAEIKDSLKCFKEYIQLNLCGHKFEDELSNFVKKRIELIEKLDKIKITSVNGIDDLTLGLKKQKGFIEDALKKVKSGNLDEQILKDFGENYDENLLKVFNSWYYSGVVLNSGDNINKSVEDKLEKDQKIKIALFKETMKNLRTKIEENKRSLGDGKLQNHNRMLQLYYLKEDIEKIENKLKTENFKGNNKLTEYEEFIIRRAGECGLVYDVKVNQEVYDQFKNTFKKFSEVTNKFYKWRDSQEINKENETIRPERVAVLQFGRQLLSNFDVGTAKVFLQSANRVIAKMDEFKKNYQKPKVSAVKKVNAVVNFPKEVKQKAEEFNDVYYKCVSIQTKLFNNKSQIGICFAKPENVRHGKVKHLFFRRPIKNNLSYAKTLIAKPDYKAAAMLGQKAINMAKQLEIDLSDDNINKFMTLTNRAINKLNFVIEHDKEPDAIAEVLNDDVSEKSNDEELKYANLDLDSDGFEELKSCNSDSDRE